jgi:transposase
MAQQILAWHSTGASNGPTEDLNSIIKKDKRVSVNRLSQPALAIAG